MFSLPKRMSHIDTSSSECRGKCCWDKTYHYYNVIIFRMKKGTSTNNTGSVEGTLTTHLLSMRTDQPPYISINLRILLYTPVQKIGKDIANSYLDPHGVNC